MLSSCPPTHSILFYSLLIKERNVQKLQYFSFVLTFIFVPSDYYYYFFITSNERASQMLSQPAESWLHVVLVHMLMTGRLQCSEMGTER